MIHLNEKQLLHKALSSAGIENEPCVCLSAHGTEDGLQHFLVRTDYMRYEFYVETLCGEVLGMSTEPLPYREFSVPGAACGGTLSAVA